MHCTAFAVLLSIIPATAGRFKCIKEHVATRAPCANYCLAVMMTLCLSHEVLEKTAFNKVVFTLSYQTHSHFAAC
jgi:hypothetical protein